MTTPPPGQPGAPGNPFGPQGQPLPQQPGQPVYGQQPATPAQPYGAQPGPGQGQPYTGQPQAGQPQPGGYAPVAGGTDYAASAPQPPARQSKLKRILITIGVVIAVAVVGGIVSNLLKDKDSGKSVDSSPVGSCITVKGSTSVTTEAIDCDSKTPSFIVGAKLADSDACEAAKYLFSVSEVGAGASDQVLCLVPNYQVGTCYTQSDFAIGIQLETVSCDTDSTMSTTNFKVTERSDTGTVPNCTDTATQRSETFDIKTDPAKQMTICAEIIGDYTWK